jgi:cytochrome c oxidase assembly protein subunit 15
VLDAGTKNLSDVPNVALTSRLALVGAVLMLCLIGVSAYLRLSAAGLGCEPWPDCFAQAASLEAQHHPIARLMHRILASTIGLVVLLVVFASFGRRSQRAAPFWISLATLALTAALAVLGRVTPAAAGALVGSGNLLGGLALLALLTWIAVDPPDAVRDDRSASVRRFQLLSYAALALTVIQVILGALLSTTHAAAACAGLIDCTAALPAASLHMLHRVLAVVLLAVDAVVCVALLRRGRFSQILASALVAAPLIQIGIGVAMLTSQFPLWLALCHNLVAALLIATAVAAARRMTSR